MEGVYRNDDNYVSYEDMYRQNDRFDPFQGSTPFVPFEQMQPLPFEMDADQLPGTTPTTPPPGPPNSARQRKGTLGTTRTRKSNRIEARLGHKQIGTFDTQEDADFAIQREAQKKSSKKAPKSVKQRKGTPGSTRPAQSKRRRGGTNLLPTNLSKYFAEQMAQERKDYVQYPSTEFPFVVYHKGELMGKDRVLADVRTGDPATTFDSLDGSESEDM